MHKKVPIVLPPQQFAKQLLTLSEHAREGYSSHFVCVSLCVCVCVCHSTTDLEDDGLPGSEMI